MHIMQITVSSQINDILKTYSAEVQQKATKTAQKVARDCAADLRRTSPVGEKTKSSGEYAKGWTVKRGRANSGGFSFIVHNKNAPGLTHLLEHGHVTRNQYGEYGTTPAHPHIAKAEEAYSAEMVEEVKKAVQ